MPRINCPHCDKLLEYESIKDLPHFPFCSERCKMVDLGLWLDEKHKISEDLHDRKDPEESDEDKQAGKGDKKR